MSTQTTDAPAANAVAGPTHSSLTSPTALHPGQPLCGHPLWGEIGGLPCMRPTGHPPGHVYHDPSGSAVDDADSGHG